MRRMLACTILVVAVGALLLSACSRKDTGIQFWHAMGGPLGDTLDVMIAQYNSTHPGTEIQSIGNANYEALSQKIMGAVAAGQPPVLDRIRGVPYSDGNSHPTSRSPFHVLFIKICGSGDVAA